jgi:hypothetical protein
MVKKNSNCYKLKMVSAAITTFKNIIISRRRLQQNRQKVPTES